MKIQFSLSPTCTMGGGQALKLEALHPTAQDRPPSIPTLTPSTSCQGMRSKRATRRRQTTPLHPSTTLTRRWATTATPMEVRLLGLYASRVVIRLWETKRRWETTWNKQVQHLSRARQLLGETGATAQRPVERGRGREPEGMLSSLALPVRRTCYRQVSASRGQDVSVQQLHQNLAEG